MKLHILSLTALLFSAAACQSNKSHTNTSKAVDIESTSDSLILFEENLISTPLYERDLAINTEGNEIIYTLGDYKQSRRALVILRKIKEVWSGPEVMNISGVYQDIEPFFANKGNRLFFASNRPMDNDISREDYNIWYSDRIEGGWSEPIALDSIINTRGDEFFPSLSDKGNLFFTASREDGVGREDIFMSEFIDNKFTAPRPLPGEINTSKFEFNAYVSPEEHLIIFSSFGRADGLGGGDLYISRKDNSGNWTASKNLGASINSNKLDYCPFVDWKSRNLYFTSERGVLENKKLENIGELKGQANSPLNGFGNIFKIGIDNVE